ncbi:hypothetical protein A3I57_00070 [Candidatus Beckwithbacteria bacterium RIFCSPLOWO2_02_FULL_47_23]|uniref:NAD-dependent epimerase/dehydratase domain-containing protein n=2 Tax=Candidatus Beckwithiibacteriota TaxID=1752726 RepID=A0A1F5E1R1_9BACT|nr:MAG: hypothetical protein A3E73_00625 [Candidatus Beckwithbacteria bacterium RIFCSPHIGHO2_12_FULL_47_17]OGD61312.1 MAG: hypothetical protein A3I57_00070 [Candidatus Beckwithbacteria bacterium RIFCSPLOWO2_02_FULL_47_23]
MKLLHIGLGFIGSRVIDKLESAGHKVDVFDLSFGQDLRDREQVIKMIAGGRYDGVILMAAIADLNVFEKDPLLGMDVNISGLINVADACSKTGTKLYFISTCCVYGNTKDLPSDENSLVEPSEVYAAAKYAGEWIIKGYHRSYDLPYAILRLATVYGPTMRPALAPAVFINQIKKGQPITVHGAGKQTRTLTYIDDLVDGIVAAVYSPVVNETINISSEEERSVNELVKIICSAMEQPDWPIEHINDRKGQTTREKINASKAKKLLHWQAKVSLEQGIKKTLQWMSENNLTIIS